MKKILSLFFMAVLAVSVVACDNGEPEIPAGDNIEVPSDSKILVAYFSWGGTTRHMAQQISEQTGGTLFEIVPVKAYPTEYTPCTEVALQERDSDARPAIKNNVEDMGQYDVVFIGCPVWWHTAPMIINTFTESYDLSGKNSRSILHICLDIPRRDVAENSFADTRIDASRRSRPDKWRREQRRKCNRVAQEYKYIQRQVIMKGSLALLMCALFAASSMSCAGSTAGDAPQPVETPATSFVGSNAPMSGSVSLWNKGNIPTVTHNVSNSDGPDFIPNIEVFTVNENVHPKGAVIICPGGAFAFRSMRNEGYDIADMLVPMGYQCFIVNYRIQPYTMRESATDLQRAIRYVKAHAGEYRINPENIALVGFSAGGILNGEVLLNWHDLTNGTALDNSYVSDELDDISVSACAVGMIYAFYGRLSVSMNNVETLRNAGLPPAFYCWGTRDGFAGQFMQNANAVEQAGCRVERKILQNYPHGYGTGGSSDVWGKDFDRFLMSVMSENAMAEEVGADTTDRIEGIYDLNGRRISPDTAKKGIYIVKRSTGTDKIYYRKNE